MAPDSVQSFPLRAVALLSISFSNEMPTLADRGQGKILNPLRAKVHSDLLDRVTGTRGKQCGVERADVKQDHFCGHLGASQRKDKE